MITIEQLACNLGVSVFTINRWYRWQRQHNLSVLPLPTRQGVRNYWQDTDVIKLKEFQNKIIKGRNGVMSNG